MSLLTGLFGPNVETLKRKKDHEGLFELRHNKSWPVRRDAIVALAELGDERGVSFLLAATQPGDGELGIALLKAVARDPKLATAVVRLAQAGGWSHATDRVFLVLETYHTKISPETLVDDLLGGREGPFWWSRPDLRRMLLPFGHRVVAHLTDLLEEPQRARKAAPLVGVLGRAAGGAAKSLIEAFKENPALISEVQAALLEIYDTGVDALLAALDDSDDRVRALATKVLTMLPRYARQRQGEGPIDPDEETLIRERVREAAAQAIGRAKNDPSELVRKMARS
jgi:HEAT repeat protein